MLSNLFKPAWQSSSVEKRLKAVATMDAATTENQQILAQLAKEDSDRAIGLAAIKKISETVVLHDLSLNHVDHSLRLEAGRRLDQLMSGAAFTRSQYLDLLARHPEFSLRLAIHAVDAEVRSDIVRGMPTDQQLELLSQTAYTESRQQVAEQLCDIEDLESARKILRGKDKNAERILKAKIDEFRAQQKLHAEQLALVDKLMADIEYLYGHDWKPEFKARWQSHCEHWDGLDFEIAADSLQRYRPMREQMEARFSQQQLIQQTQQSQQALLDELEELSKRVAGWDLAQSMTGQGELTQSLLRMESNWRAFGEIIQPEEALQRRFSRHQSALQSVGQLLLDAEDTLPPANDESDRDGSAEALDNQTMASQIERLNDALNRLSWPVDNTPLAIAVELRQQLADWRKALQASADAYQQSLDQLHKKISSVFRFSRAGHLGRAKQLAARVEKALESFSGKDRAGLEERWQEAQKTLGEMGDWKDFATEPKYIELCVAMESLADSRLAPDKLATEIKGLQQQWKEVGYSEISDQYWPRFKLAADTVYQPCAEFFAERHQIREENFQLRQQIVDQMRLLLEQTDWDDSPDYRAAQSSVQRIGDDFARIKDVEQGPGQRQWKQFSRLRDEIYARLDVAYSANIDIKQQLIKQTAALAEGEAKESNLAALKTLQARWKQVGITRRKDDQKAWLEFKKQGDAVYNKVQQLRQADRSEQDRQLNAYRDLIGQIKELAKSAEDLVQADQRYAELQAAYAELPELDSQLPEKLRDGIERDFRNACDRYDESHKRMLSGLQSQQIDALKGRADLCLQLETLGATADAQQLADISRQWDAIALQDAEFTRRIEQRRESALTSIDREVIGSERRLLCIQLEIALGVDSPAEDRTLRMQYQLDRMNESGLGQQSLNNADLIAQMELDWLCMPGAESRLQHQLDERFQRVLGSAGK